MPFLITRNLRGSPWTNWKPVYNLSWWKQTEGNLPSFQCHCPETHAVFYNAQHGFMCNWGGTRKESRERRLNSSLKIDCNSLFSATQNIATRALNLILFFHTVSTHPKFASPLWAWKDRKKRKHWTCSEIEVYVRGASMVWIFKIILQRNIEGASFFICPYFKHKKTLPTLTCQGLL